MREFGQELLAAVGDRRRSRLHLRLPQASRSRRSLQDVSLYRRGLALVVFWLAELRGLLVLAVRERLSSVIPRSGRHRGPAGWLHVMFLNERNGSRACGRIWCTRCG